MNVPRNHHYIPQFWLKRFSYDGNSKLVWSYDWGDDKIEKRSISKLMAEYDLYTQHTSGGLDVTLETGEMGIVDNTGAQLFRKLDDGDRSSALREELADFFAVMALRHPTTVNRYPTAAAGLLLNIHEAVDVANGHADFIDQMARRGLPDFAVTLSEFVHLKSATAQTRDLMFAQLFDSCLGPAGNPDTPFADVITDKSGRATLRGRLLGMRWVIRKANDPRLVIGDTGIVFERGESDMGWKIILDPNHALLITKSEQPVSNTIGDAVLEPWEGDNLNVESAARSVRLLVGKTKSAVEKVTQHIPGC
jgi:Protein of unknown function (DUF4238)